jgi:tRNA threonylcarbamoyl adenosine modification protein YjeE
MLKISYLMLSPGLERLNKRDKLTDSLYTIASCEEMTRFGSKFGTRLKVPAVVALSGCLGAGKTTIAKGIISALTDVPLDAIMSPTFQYVHFYEKNGITVAHFDLWRLTTLHDFLSMGLDDFLEIGVAIVEWPDRIASILPGHTVYIESQVVEGGRLVRVSSNE